MKQPRRISLCSAGAVALTFGAALAAVYGCAFRGLQSGTTEAKQAGGAAEGGDNSTVTNVTLQWAGRNAGGLTTAGSIGLLGTLGAYIAARRAKKLATALMVAIEYHEPLEPIKQRCAKIAAVHGVSGALDRHLRKLGYRKT